jgi:ComF family protein
MFASFQNAVNFARRKKSTWTRACAALESLLAPPICVLCDRAGMPGPLDLCAGCLASLPRRGDDDPLPASAYAQVCCPWSFDFPVDALVRALKFHGERCHARVLGTLLGRERAALGPPWPDLVAPVPLHALRLRTRGYNQAAELAAFAARELGVDLDRHALRRTRATREQSSLRSHERGANVRGAFAAARSCAGLRVALVDDVVTTGSTVAAAAATLRAAGAADIELWVVARAARHAQRATRSVLRLRAIRL